MKNLVLLSLVTLLFGASACNTIDTPDGKIPPEYMAIAQSVAGSYPGNFGGHSANMSISFNDRSPVLTYSDSFGYDLIGKLCGSTVGKLKSFSTSASSSGEYVDGASFEFDPGFCPIYGRELNLEFKSDSGHMVINAWIIRDAYTVHDPGNVVCHTNGHGRENCHMIGGGTHLEYRYITGRFVR